jgi:hypothetical protein
MKTRLALIGFSTILTLISLSAHAAPGASKTDSCALLKPDDLTALLGGMPTGKPKKEMCSWTVSGNPKRLITIQYPDDGMGAEMGFANAKRAPSKGGPAIDEANIGDEAFSRLLPTGVVLIAVKQKKLLQLQFHTGAAGTDQDLNALREVAKKAIAAY